MAIRHSLDTMFLCWLSQPKWERELYQRIRRGRIGRIVELGIESHLRTQRLIRVARRYAPDGDVHYCGIDLFDTRPTSQPPMTLKQTHQALSGSGAAVRLIPGDAQSALARCANQLQGTQLLLIGPDHDAALLMQAWVYLPRMLATGAIVLRATRSPEWRWECIERATIQAEADALLRQRRAA